MTYCSIPFPVPVCPWVGTCVGWVAEVGVGGGASPEHSPAITLIPLIPIYPMYLSSDVASNSTSNVDSMMSLSAEKDPCAL